MYSVFYHGQVLPQSPHKLAAAASQGVAGAQRRPGYAAAGTAEEWASARRCARPTRGLRMPRQLLVRFTVARCVPHGAPRDLSADPLCAWRTTKLAGARAPAALANVGLAGQKPGSTRSAHHAKRPILLCGLKNILFRLLCLFSELPWMADDGGPHGRMWREVAPYWPPRWGGDAAARPARARGGARRGGAPTRRGGVSPPGPRAPSPTRWRLTARLPPRQPVVPNRSAQSPLGRAAAAAAVAAVAGRGGAAVAAAAAAWGGRRRQ